MAGRKRKHRASAASSGGRGRGRGTSAAGASGRLGRSNDSRVQEQELSEASDGNPADAGTEQGSQVGLAPDGSPVEPCSDTLPRSLSAAAPVDDGNDNGGGREDAGQRARKRFLNIARSRAAHFAHFNTDELAEEVGEQQETRGGRGGQQDEEEEEYWPGPFAVARRLVQGRAAAAEARRDQRGAAAPAAQAASEHASPEVHWVPSRNKTSRYTGEGIHNTPLQGSERSGLPTRTPPPRLYDLCARQACECVEQLTGSLGDLPDLLRTDLMRIMCARRKLTGSLLVELTCGSSSKPGDESEFARPSPAAVTGASGSKTGSRKAREMDAEEEAEAGGGDCSILGLDAVGISELRLKDCSLIGEDDLKTALRHTLHRGLEVLELNFCGRSLSDTCASGSLSSCLKVSGFKGLKEIHLGGAYRLTAEGLEALARAPASSEQPSSEALARGLEGMRQVSVAPPAADAASEFPTRLQILSAHHCSLLTGSALPTHCWLGLSEHLHTLALDFCPGLDAAALVPALELLSRARPSQALTLSTGLQAGAEGGSGSTGLKHLSLAGLPGLTDGLLASLLLSLGPSLESLGLAQCMDLGDGALEAIAVLCPQLRSLDLTHLAKITDEGLNFLASACRSLRTLLLSRASKLSSGALVNFLSEAGGALQKFSVNSIKNVDDAVVMALVTNSRVTIQDVDVSWCRAVSDAALGLLADSCPRLCRLTLYGCSQVTPLFSDGHSNAQLQLFGLVAVRAGA